MDGKEAVSRHQGSVQVFAVVLVEDGSALLESFKGFFLGFRGSRISVGVEGYLWVVPYDRQQSNVPQGLQFRVIGGPRPLDTFV